ncbi:MAG: 4Fe-4S dicluster domain-containing protein [Planctomycetota bacterium]
MANEVARDVLEVDVLFVGGGPASLLSAIHLSNLIKTYRKHLELTKEKGVPPLSEVSIMVLEKGANPGAHSISGAVLDPIALKKVFPNFLKEGFPIQAEVNSKNESVYFLTDRWSFKSPILPPPFHNEGNYIVSLGEVVKWLAKKAEETGMIDVYTGFPAASPLIENGKVVGVRCQDRGIDKNGNQKNNFEAGMDIRAKVTIFGEGSRGSCTRQVIERLGLEGAYPQQYSLGIKEVWEVPQATREKSRLKKGGVIHTAGYPLSTEHFGGSWIYGMDNNLISLGLVAALDYADPYLDPHELFQKFKMHPLVKEILKDGKLVSYGAKTIPEGGYFAMPTCYGEGFLLIGDSAGLINMTRLKGIHLAMQSGVFAAETVMNSLKGNNFSSFALSEYKWLLENSWVKKELWKARYFRQGFHNGFVAGVINTGFEQTFNGWTPFVSKPAKPTQTGTNFLIVALGILVGLLGTSLFTWGLSLIGHLQNLLTQMPFQAAGAFVGASLLLGFLHFEMKAKPHINFFITLPVMLFLFFTPALLWILGLGSAFYQFLQPETHFANGVHCAMTALFCFFGITLFHHLRHELPLSFSSSSKEKNFQESFGLFGWFLDIAFRSSVWIGDFIVSILFEDPKPEKLDHQHYKTLTEFYGGHPPEKMLLSVDNKYLFDKVSDVYHSGTIHEENQPPHLRVQDLDICKDRCTHEYGNPCQYFCPTAVYEMVEDLQDTEGRKKLFLNFSNCVHCKTCDIKDPYGQIVWWVPEGGGGPNYNKL